MAILNSLAVCSQCDGGDCYKWDDPAESARPCRLFTKLCLAWL